MFSWLQESSIYIVNILFGLYSFIILLRFLFQCARVNFYNPISQFLLSATNPLLIPIRRFVPGFFGLDIPALILLLFVSYIKMLLLSSLYGLLTLPVNPLLFVNIFLWIGTELAFVILNVYFWALIILILFSWLTVFGVISPYKQNPIIAVIEQLVAPLTNRARSIIPAIGGLDLSPILIFIVIKVLQGAIYHLPAYTKAPWGFF